MSVRRSGLSLVLLLGCYASHEVSAEIAAEDASIDVAHDTRDGRPEACGCAPVRLVATVEASRDDRFLAVFDVARLDDRLVALVARPGPILPLGQLPNAYGLIDIDLASGRARYRRSTGDPLSPDRLTGAGGLRVDPGGRVVANVIQANEIALVPTPVELAEVAWNDDEVSIRHLATTSPEIPGHTWHRSVAVVSGATATASLIAAGPSVEGVVVDRDGIEIRRGDFVQMDGPEPAPLDGVYLDDSSLVLVGGGSTRDSSTARPAFWAIVRGDEVASAIPLSGERSDPPPVVTRVGDGFVIYRFVTNPDDLVRSAVHEWKYGSDGRLIEERTFPTANGLTPWGMDAAHGDWGSMVVWVEPTPSAPGEADVHALVHADPSDGCVHEGALMHVPYSIRRHHHVDGGLHVHLDEAGWFLVLIEQASGGNRAHVFFRQRCAEA